MNDLTVLVPVYNEEESLPRFKEAMDEFLAMDIFPVNILFINDGSTDSSYAILRNIVRSDKRYELISLAENSGLSAAIKAGIDQVRTTWTGYIDADLQTSPMDFLKYFGYMDSCDMITGIRTHRHDSFIKRWSSRIANAVRSRLIGDGIQDTCCPLKIVKTDYAVKIPFFNGMHRFLPALIQLQGGRVEQVEVQHFARSAGVSKYNLRNRLTGPFLDMLAFIWMKKRYLHYSVIRKEMEPTYRRETSMV